MSVAEVTLWGTQLGAVAWNSERGLACFEYAPDVIGSGVQPAPLSMPLATGIQSFADLDRRTFHGLPGLLAECLPGEFGNAVMSAWLESQGLVWSEMDPVERLRYVGNRTPGALEFGPALGHRPRGCKAVEVDQLATMAVQLVAQPPQLSFDFARPDYDPDVLRDLALVAAGAAGTSGKAMVSYNPATGEVLTGHLPGPEGFAPWLLKFDRAADARGGTDGLLIEAVYLQMAAAAGIDVPDWSLLRAGESQHLLTRRFDRDERGGKLHRQSLIGLLHWSTSADSGYDYEQVFTVLLELGCGRRAVEQQFRRLAFDLLAGNSTPAAGIDLLMDKRGNWQLGPAHGLRFQEGQAGSVSPWRVNGRRERVGVDDLCAAAASCDIKRRRAQALIKEVDQGVRRWRELALDAGVDEKRVRDIARQMVRL